MDIRRHYCSQCYFWGLSQILYKIDFMKNTRKFNFLLNDTDLSSTSCVWVLAHFPDQLRGRPGSHTVVVCFCPLESVVWRSVVGSKCLLGPCASGLIVSKSGGSYPQDSPSTNSVPPTSSLPPSYLTLDAQTANLQSDLTDMGMKMCVCVDLLAMRVCARSPTLRCKCRDLQIHL